MLKHTITGRHRVTLALRGLSRLDATYTKHKIHRIMIHIQYTCVLLFVTHTSYEGKIKCSLFYLLLVTVKLHIYKYGYRISLKMDI
jgi:hypothetical protein